MYNFIGGKKEKKIKFCLNLIINFLLRYWEMKRSIVKIKQKNYKLFENKIILNFLNENIVTINEII